MPPANGLLTTDYPSVPREQVRGPWEPPVGQEPVSAPWEPPSPGGTHLGLPLRVRQANLAPQLRRQAAEEPAEPTPPDEPAKRSPEETLSMMSAFQDGWLRGRTDAIDELADEPADETRESDVQHAHDGEASL